MGSLIFSSLHVTVLPILGCKKVWTCAGWSALEHDITNTFQSWQPSRRLYAEGSTQADLIPRKKSKVHDQGTYE